MLWCIYREFPFSPPVHPASKAGWTGGYKMINGEVLYCGSVWQISCYTSIDMVKWGKWRMINHIKGQNT